MKGAIVSDPDRKNLTVLLFEDLKTSPAYTESDLPARVYSTDAGSRVWGASVPQRQHLLHLYRWSRYGCSTETQLEIQSTT